MKLFDFWYLLSNLIITLRIFYQLTVDIWQGLVLGYIGKKIGYWKYNCLVFALAGGIVISSVLEDHVTYMLTSVPFIACMVDEILHMKPPKPPKKLKKLANKLKVIKQPQPIKQPV